MSKNSAIPSIHYRRKHWQHRAEQCRALADQFRNATCRAQLRRLAETYDVMVASSDGAAPVE